MNATAFVSFVAWRAGKNYGFYHMTQDNRRTLCGRRPDGLLSVWPKRQPPPVEDQCATCRKRLLEGK